jgi:hypothetical protein
MEEKKPFKIDEDALREKLLSYHVSFNPASLDFLENEIDHVKTRPPFKLPETKKILQFAAVPVILVAFGFVAYFGFNYIKDISENTSSKKDTTVVVKPKVEPKLEVKKEEIKPPIVTTASVATEVTKKDSIVPTATIAVVPKQIKDSNKKPTTEQVIFPKKEDTTQAANIVKTKPDTIKKTTVADTSSASKNKDGTTKKKKKKKKSSDVTDEIRQSTQQPNSADDDVVVPNN